MASLTQGQASPDLDKPWGAMPGLRVPRGAAGFNKGTSCGKQK